MVSNCTLLYTIGSEVLYKHGIEQDEEVTVKITELKMMFFMSFLFQTMYQKQLTHRHQTD